eukprot:511617-Hanusia_phi.AAC.1
MDDSSAAILSSLRSDFISKSGAARLHCTGPAPSQDSIETGGDSTVTVRRESRGGARALPGTRWSDPMLSPPG